VIVSYALFATEAKMNVQRNGIYQKIAHGRYRSRRTPQNERWSIETGNGSAKEIKNSFKSRPAAGPATISCPLQSSNCLAASDSPHYAQ
jgi:hypothetical protein